MKEQLSLFDSTPAPIRQRLTVESKYQDGTPLYITATERKAINLMLSNGWTFAHNRNKTKAYSVVNANPATGEYLIEIQTRERRTIGADVTTNIRTVKIKKP